jgi:hypothetical protein
MPADETKSALPIECPFVVHLRPGTLAEEGRTDARRCASSSPGGEGSPGRRGVGEGALPGKRGEGTWGSGSPELQGH